MKDAWTTSCENTAAQRLSHPLGRQTAIHLAVLALGAAFLLLDAFHGNIWFDESYSVAIANHGVADIVRLGAADVHPVLYYIALRAVRLIFGQSVLAYRLFSVAGSVALAALGIGCIRRDLGARTGMAFSFLALFTPYVSHMAIEIRMYSWSAFAVTVCFVYALRIGRACRRGGAGARIPLSWWIIFHVSSLAAAYLHYFGTISAFLICAGLMVGLLRARVGRAVWIGAIGGAAIQVLCYLPWLAVLFGQVARVQHGFWITVFLPGDIAQTLLFPVFDPWVIDGVTKLLGLPAGSGLESIVFPFSGLVFILASPFALAPLLFSKRDPRCALGFLLYFGLAALTMAISAIGQPIFQYRYLYVAIGPLLLSWALGLSDRCRELRGRPAEIRPRSGACSQRIGFAPGALRWTSLWTAALTGALAIFLALAGVGKIGLTRSVYAPENADPIERLRALGVGAPGGPELWTDNANNMGLIAVAAPELSIQLVDSWHSRANYGEVFAPYAVYHRDGDWGAHAAGERFVVLSQYRAADDAEDREKALSHTAAHLMRSLGSRGRVLTATSRAMYRPYEQVWYVITDVEAL